MPGCEAFSGTTARCIINVPVLNSQQGNAAGHSASRTKPLGRGCRKWSNVEELRVHSRVQHGLVSGVRSWMELWRRREVLLAVCPIEHNITEQMPAIIQPFIHLN